MFIKSMWSNMAIISEIRHGIMYTDTTKTMLYALLSMPSKHKRNCKQSEKLPMARLPPS